MTRSIRLVVIVSSPVPSDDDETKMNVEKHECSLLKVVSDVGSTPTASTILYPIHYQRFIRVRDGPRRAQGARLHPLKVEAAPQPARPLTPQCPPRLWY